MNKERFIQDLLPLQQKLFAFAFRLLRSREEAEDAVQDIYVKLWRKRRQLGEYKSVEAFAMTVTKNHCLDLLRKKKTLSLEEQEGALNRPAEAENPEHKLEQAEVLLKLEETLREMPEKYRLVLQLRDIEGYSYEEIAEKTEVNINTLRVNLSRARKIVRDELEKMHDYGRAVHPKAFG